MLIAVSLGACVTSNQPVPLTTITLPEAPANLEKCFRKAFPDIPDRDLNKRDVVRIIGGAKVLDRVKTACGKQAVRWIEDVHEAYGKQPQPQ